MTSINILISVGYVSTYRYEIMNWYPTMKKPRYRFNYSYKLLTRHVYNCLFASVHFYDGRKISTFDTKEWILYIQEAYVYQKGICHLLQGRKYTAVLHGVHNRRICCYSNAFLKNKKWYTLQITYFYKIHYSCQRPNFNGDR